MNSYCLMCNCILSPINGASNSEDANNTNDSIINSTEAHKEWIFKYTGFLSKVFKMDFSLAKPTLHILPDSRCNEDSLSEEVVPFCPECRAEVEKFYSINESLESTQKEFESMRNSIASSMVRTFLEQKYKFGEKELLNHKVNNSFLTTSDKVFNKWKSIYSGELEKSLKEKNLLSQMREEMSIKKGFSWKRGKTKYPEGTGLTTAELAKMQRMMTACYFTPKMSIVRKRGMLFFRVGMPEGEDMSFSCNLCSEKFKTQRSLYVHIRRHKVNSKSNKMNGSHCIKCGDFFTDRRDLILHKSTHNNKPLLKKKSKSSLDESEGFICGVCGVRFPSKLSRTAHFRKNHPIEENSSSQKGKIEKSYSFSEKLDIYQCPSCSKIFLKSENLEKHLPAHENEKLLECDYCGLACEDQVSLTDHFNDSHDLSQPFNCEICPKRFISEDYLNKHTKTHSKLLNLCPKCGKIFSSKESLHMHSLSHQTGNKSASLICEYCSALFSDRKSLEAHIKKHKGTLPFKCNFCTPPETFKDVLNFRKHRVEKHPETLVNDPAYICQTCYVDYPSDEELQQHISKIHERYKCHICDRIFKLGDHLRRHVLIHTGEKPYSCHLCSKSFNQETNLKEHLYRHSGVKPHRCDYCPRVAFIRRIQLKDHMEKVHGVSGSELSSLPIGRAAQNERLSNTSIFVQGNSIEEPEVPQKPVIINDVTIGEGEVHGRIAPLIMKSLQNHSNQPIIVRRGMQVPEKSPIQIPYPIELKTEGISVDHIVDSQGNYLESGQQYVIYL